MAVCWDTLRASNTTPAERENFEDWAISRQLLIFILRINFKKALRDYTPHTQTLKKTGDEIVQTTTLKSLAAGESQCGR